MLSKRSQVQIFLRCEEEGQRVQRGRDRRRSEGGTGGDREAPEKVLVKEKERGRGHNRKSVCVPLGVKQ